MTPRFKTKYREEIIASLQEEFNYKNVMMVPKLEKIVVSKGIGAAVADKKLVDQAIAEMTMITGQKAVSTKSKKDVSNFKLRKGMPIVARVTLRGDQMYEFLDRLVTIALPRVRYFRGLNGKSFDGNGNYAMGIKEQIIFPEVDYDQVDEVRGMDIIVVTSANTDDEARELLANFQFPFIKA